MPPSRRRESSGNNTRTRSITCRAPPSKGSGGRRSKEFTTEWMQVAGGERENAVGVADGASQRCPKEWKSFGLHLVQRPQVITQSECPQPINSRVLGLTADRHALCGAGRVPTGAGGECRTLQTI
jgi:hypothetical protein